MSTEPTNSYDSNENEEEEETSSPKLTVLTTVAYDYSNLSDSKPFDRMDIDNHNIEFDDSNQVSSTTESTTFQQSIEPTKSVLNETSGNVEVVQNDNPPRTKEDGESTSKRDKRSVSPDNPPSTKEEDESTSKRDKRSVSPDNPPSTKEEDESTSKRDKRSASPNCIPGTSRYGRVRKQKRSTDFVSMDRKSFAVLNSNSYKPTISDSLETRPKVGKPKRAYRKKYKYVAENVSTIATKEDAAEESANTTNESVDNAEDESSRSSLTMSAIKTYSRKSDVITNADEKLVTSNDSENVVQVNYSELGWKVGDVAWAKIGCYPYWPSIVTLEYGTSIYARTVGKQQSRLAVHVHFFGDRGRRSWVLTTSLMKYESKEQFMELRRQYSKDKLRIKNFLIAPRIEDLWEKAVSEADTILKLPIDERMPYYQNLYPMMNDIFEITNINKTESSPVEKKERGRKRKILNDDISDNCIANKKAKLEKESPSKLVTNETKEKREREPIDEHTKKRRAFMRRMNQILKQSNAASLPPKKRINLQVKSEQAFNKLLDNSTLQDNSSSSPDSKKNDLSVYDFESDEETDIFIGTYNSKFTPQILSKIENTVETKNAAEKKPELPSTSQLPISIASSTSSTTPSTKATPTAILKTDSETSPPTVAKRKVGRPKGAKNKVKNKIVPVLKRKRGRPPKPKNLGLLLSKPKKSLNSCKPKIVVSEESKKPLDSSEITVVQEKSQETLNSSNEVKTEAELPKKVEKRRPGRPRGSKNRVKNGVPLPRKRGRPLGSGLKNKIKSGTALQNRRKAQFTAGILKNSMKRPRGRPRKHPLVETGTSQLGNNSSSNEENKTTAESLAKLKENPATQEFEAKKRVSEKAKKSVSEENDLSSEEEEVKSEEEKRRSGSPLSAPSSSRFRKSINIFLGVKNEKVCQICLKPGDTIRCRGPCCGYFHFECDRKSEINKKNADCAKGVSRRGRKRLSLKNMSTDLVRIGDVSIKSEPVENLEAEPEATDVIGEDVVALDLEASPKEEVAEGATIENCALDSEASPKEESAEVATIENGALDSEASPKEEPAEDATIENGVLDSEVLSKEKEIEEDASVQNGVLNSEALPKNELAKEENSLRIVVPDMATVDAVFEHFDRVDANDADPVTSTNTLVNGIASSEDEVSMQEEKRETGAATKKNNNNNNNNADLQIDNEEESAENEISSSTGEKSNGDRALNAKVNGVACAENEETCSSEASAESNNSCAKTSNGNGVDFYCKRCSEERLYPCFSCGQETQDKTKETSRYTCYVVACGRTYHKECLKEWPQASWGTGSSLKESLRCPQHYCHTCISENPAVLKNKHCNEILVRCVKCPTSYHKRVHCVPAGTEILSSSQIICPRHYEPPLGMKHAHFNASWCFICCIGGSLICCDSCPMSFHAECLKLRPEEYEGRYLCDDCQTGRFILYGEIAWVKLGHYRWWPAKVLFPYEVPENIQNLPHRRGEFVVEFFGTHDYNWVNRGRAFLYQEGDSGRKSCKRNSVDMSFEKAMTEAEEAYKQLVVDKAARDEVARLGLKPPRYVRIKANKPVGNVKIFETNTSHITACECDPKSEKPCAIDTDCLNRMLLVECNPLVCPAGERCMNQAFEKRVYPPLMPYKTDKRGWGLKTLVDMKKGDFIIEYVGEMIDEEEYKRRVNIMHKKHEDNYYFLTIDNQRMLDAGPKGNVSRFMNHSCDPNCETQKWTVNGDTRIGLFALKDIPANTELVFNYNLATLGNEKRPCYCGAENCSGFIGVKAIKNGSSGTDEESRKKSSDEARKRSAETGSSAAANTNKANPKKRRKKKLKKNKRLRPEGKLAAAKRTTDLRIKMKNRAMLSAVKEEASENLLTGDARFKHRIKLGRTRLRRAKNAELEASLLISNTSVGEYTSPKTEALFKQRDLFRKDATKTVTKKKNSENEPYVERRGRKKIPKDDNEKKDLFFQILKHRIEQKIEKMTVNEVEDKCFKCGAEGELLYCDNNACPKGYHLPCVNKTLWPTGRWLCPWHYCLICNSKCRIIRCSMCVNAFCGNHHKGNIFEESEDKYSCKEHKSEKAIQASFRSVAMMRLLTVKTENSEDSAENIVQLIEPDLKKGKRKLSEQTVDGNPNNDILPKKKSFIKTTTTSDGCNDENKDQDKDETKTIRKVSRTARKSIRSSASCLPIALKSENVGQLELSTAEELDTSDKNDDTTVAEMKAAHSSDDEFVDFEVEVLNDSD